MRCSTVLFIFRRCDVAYAPPLRRVHANIFAACSLPHYDFTPDADTIDSALMKATVIRFDVLRADTLQRATLMSILSI